ncbi:MAG: hypothetical protein AB7O52_17365 [Planctomycetota bacterium]
MATLGIVLLVVGVLLAAAASRPTERDTARQKTALIGGILVAIAGITTVVGNLLLSTSSTSEITETTREEAAATKETVLGAADQTENVVQKEAAETNKVVQEESERIQGTVRQVADITRETIEKLRVEITIDEAYIILYDDKDFRDRQLTIRYPDAPADFDQVRSDDNKRGFEDKPSSAKWSIPKGWKAVLFKDKNCDGDRYELKGTGKEETNADLGGFGDNTSSVCWERAG